MIEISAGTPIATAIQNAQTAAEIGSWEEAGFFYTKALKLTTSLSESKVLRRELWVEHVGLLVAREKFSKANETVRQYLTAARTFNDYEAEFELQVLLGETLAAQGAWSKFHETLLHLEAFLKIHSNSHPQLNPNNSYLIRLQGLAAFEFGNLPLAHRLLTRAKEHFEGENNQRGLQIVKNDIRRLDLLSGNKLGLEDVLSPTDLYSTHDYLLYARALRRDARYETAVHILKKRLENDIEPTLRFPLLHELILLYKIMADECTVQKLIPLLEKAARYSGDPVEAYTVLERLRGWQDEGFITTEGKNYEARLHTVRALIQKQDLAKAEEQLRQLRPEAVSNRFAAYWALVAGELEFSLGTLKEDEQGQSHAQEAINHLTLANNLAWEGSLPQVYSQTIRLLGKVHAYLKNDLTTASKFWASGNRTDELFAHRQETDQARIRYLEALPTQYDELINVAADQAKRTGRVEGVAGVLASLEASRGATILSSILPSDAQRFREIPKFNDSSACWEWYTNITAELPRNQAIWLLHSSPDKLHHGIVGYGIIHWVSTNVDRQSLSNSIEKLKECWSSAEILESFVQEQDYLTDCINDIADMLRLDLALGCIPKHITRLAIVAGGALGDIPYSCLPLPDNSSPSRPLIAKFALTDLPCLSAIAPLVKRAGFARGDSSLLVRPSDTGLSSLSLNPSQKPQRVLEKGEATIENFEETLKSSTYPIVRLDCHGVYQFDEPLESRLQLSPSRHSDGKLTARQLMSLNLRNCGTLMLGACESGMSHRLGRDERLGFVRAGLFSGASSVLAARWIAADSVARIILDRFQGYLRFLPKDQALRHAQLDILEGRCLELRNSQIPFPGHLARWACWTLYGNSGYQTRANFFTRILRRISKLLEFLL